MKRQISILLVFTLATGSFAVAHSGAMGIVKERMDTMKSIAGNMKMISKSLRAEKADPDVLQSAAQDISEHAAKIANQFGEKNIDKPSEASPLIWDEQERFNAIALELQEASTVFATQIAEGAANSALQDTFKAMGATCRACHQDFRIAQ